MKVIYQLFVKGIPKAQPRPRMAASGHVYNPNSADAWKEEIKMAFLPFRYRNPTLTGPVCVTVRFLFPSPKGLEITGGSFVPHIKKPDTDNLLKAVLDSMTAAGVWKDDAQVFKTVAGKYYANRNSHTGAEIIVEA